MTITHDHSTQSLMMLMNMVLYMKCETYPNLTNHAVWYWTDLLSLFLVLKARFWNVSICNWLEVVLNCKLGT